MECLALFSLNLDKFLRCFIIVDPPWIRRPNSRCIIHIELSSKGKNDQNYPKLLARFSDDLKKKWPHFAKKKVLFQDNEKVYTCVMAMAKFDKLGYQFLSRPSYYRETISCFKTWRNDWAKRHLPLPKQTPILRTSTNIFIWKGSTNCI